VKFWLGIEGGGMRVGDVHFETAEQFLAGLEALRSLSRRLGFRHILFQTYPGSKLDAALATRFKGFESWMAGYLEVLPGMDFQQYRPNYGDQDSF
jgi:hypothetical protein